MKRLAIIFTVVILAVNAMTFTAFASPSFSVTKDKEYLTYMWRDSVYRSQGVSSVSGTLNLIDKSVFSGGSLSTANILSQALVIGGNIGVKMSESGYSQINLALDLPDSVTSLALTFFSSDILYPEKTLAGDYSFTGYIPSFGSQIVVYNNGKYVTTLDINPRPDTSKSFYRSGSMFSSLVDINSLNNGLYDNRFNPLYQTQFVQSMLYLKSDDFGLDSFGQLDFDILLTHDISNIGANWFSKSDIQIRPFLIYNNIQYNPSDNDLSTLLNSIENGFASVNDNIDETQDILVNPTPSQSEAIQSQQSVLSEQEEIFSNYESEVGAVTLTPEQNEVLSDLNDYIVSAGDDLKEAFNNPVGTPFALFGMMFESGDLQVHGMSWQIWCTLLLFAFALVSILLYGRSDG